MRGMAFAFGQLEHEAGLLGFFLGDVAMKLYPDHPTGLAFALIIGTFSSPSRMAFRAVSLVGSTGDERLTADLTGPKDGAFVTIL